MKRFNFNWTQVRVSDDEESNKILAEEILENGLYMLNGGMEAWCYDVLDGEEDRKWYHDDAGYFFMVAYADEAPVASAAFGRSTNLYQVYVERAYRSYGLSKLLTKMARKLWSRNLKAVYWNRQAGRFFKSEGIPHLENPEYPMKENKNMTIFDELMNEIKRSQAWDQVSRGELKKALDSGARIRMVHWKHAAPNRFVSIGDDGRYYIHDTDNPEVDGRTISIYLLSQFDWESLNA